MTARRIALLLFFGASFVYHANLRPVASADSIPAALLPFAIIAALRKMEEFQLRGYTYPRDDSR